ncbi:MAG: TIGR03560 family F420-dependent LLM class oxidoreductase [Acidimicrobiia bacterium]|jgi:F420-dependent oxidoreductase-like protein
MELRLPAPCLVVLVGPSGSGKSTWASEHFEPTEVVSSDTLRSVVGAGEDDQTAGTAAFQILEIVVAERLGRGMTTVVDTLGFDAESRARWVRMAHDAGIPAHCIVFDTPPAMCAERNSSRDRPIPKTVLNRQIRRFAEIRGLVEDEAFDGVHTQQPVAAVPPVIAAATRSATSDRRSESHGFGLLVSRFDWDSAHLGERLAAIAVRAEKAGFRDIWLMDHFRQIHAVGRPWEDIPEAYTALGYVAGTTSSIRMGALVTGITHRHPVVLGKMIATLDVLSGGRAICGLGVAWDEAEHAAYGIEFPPAADRYDLLEDTLRMLPELWGKGSPAFEGKTFSARELVCYPRPIQDPIPIMVGGSGEKKTLRLVAEYADACNLFGDPGTVRHKVEVLRRHCDDVDRDPREITVTHLTNAMAAEDSTSLRRRVEAMRDRNTSAEEYMTRVNAGTVDHLVELFHAYSDSGARHSIVSLPDVAKEGSIESFAEVIARFANP